MTEQMARLFVEASENAGNEAELRKEYYGRGMGDNHTFGVVVSSEVQLLADLIQYMKENIGESSFMDGGEQKVMEYVGAQLPEPENFRVDNMGHGVIIY